MMFVCGPLYSGKKTFIKKTFGYSEEDLAAHAVWDVQALVTADMMEQDLTALADRLAQQEIVIATEVGGGVVPMEAQERAKRECAGRLGCLLAERAETVVRVFCGIPMVLKGGRLE